MFMQACLSVFSGSVRQGDQTERPTDILNPLLNVPCHEKKCLRAYADSKSPDQPAHPCSLIMASLVRQHIHWTNECINGEQWPGWYFAQDDLNLRILRMFEGPFTLGKAQIVLKPSQKLTSLIPMFLWFDLLFSEWWRCLLDSSAPVYFCFIHCALYTASNTSQQTAMMVLTNQVIQINNLNSLFIHSNFMT